MKNINQISKRYFLEIICWAEYVQKEDLMELRNEMSEDLADMFFIDSFSEKFSEVLDWVQTCNFFSDDEDSDKKEERLTELLCRKAKRIASNYIDYHSPFNSLMRAIKEHGGV